jgi:hypothetical protein
MITVRLYDIEQGRFHIPKPFFLAICTQPLALYDLVDNFFSRQVVAIHISIIFGILLVSRLHGTLHRISPQISSGYLYNCSRSAIHYLYPEKCDQEQPFGTCLPFLRTQGSREDHLCPDICKNDQLPQSFGRYRALQPM